MSQLFKNSCRLDDSKSVDIESLKEDAEVKLIDHSKSEETFEFEVDKSKKIMDLKKRGIIDVSLDQKYILDLSKSINFGN